MTSRMMEHPDRMVIYPSRRKLMLGLLSMCAFVALGLWTVSPGMESLTDSVKRFPGSYLAIAFFGATGLYAAYRIASRRPALQVDATGITDTSHPFAPGHLCWHEVDRIVLYKYMSQPMLGIVPKDLDHLLSRHGAHVRTYAKTNLAFGVPPFSISQVTLPISVAELANLLHTRYGVRAEGLSSIGFRSTP